MKIKMDCEDRNAVSGPVKIGIGTEKQFGALYKAGAEDVRTHHWVKGVIDEDVDALFIVFRPEDTVVMVQPNLLSAAELKLVSQRGSNFHVPECGDFNLKTDTAIQLFRKLKPPLPGVERVENRHGKIKYPQPTEADIKMIVEWWRNTGLKQKAVTSKVSALMGAQVPTYWVRDQVKKATGSAARHHDNKEAGDA